MSSKRLDNQRRDLVAEQFDCAHDHLVGHSGLCAASVKNTLAGGKAMFDSEANLWVGDNFTVGWQAVPTENPRRLTITSESVDNHCDGRSPQVDLVRRGRAIPVASSAAKRNPWLNVLRRRSPKRVAVRLIGSIRRECLDHVVVFGERHLRKLLASYQEYYNKVRTHLSLHKDAPVRRVAACWPYRSWAGWINSMFEFEFPTRTAITEVLCPRPIMTKTAVLLRSRPLSACPLGQTMLVFPFNWCRSSRSVGCIFSGRGQKFKLKKGALDETTVVRKVYSRPTIINVKADIQRHLKYGCRVRGNTE
jgi:hypothetical protein